MVGNVCITSCGDSYFLPYIEAAGRTDRCMTGTIATASGGGDGGGGGGSGSDGAWGDGGWGIYQFFFRGSDKKTSF